MTFNTPFDLINAQRAANAITPPSLTESSMLDRINFEAVVKPIYDDSGREISPDIARGVYRDDTGDLISICGPIFKPVQHMDTVLPLVQELERGGIQIEERMPDQRGLYDLKGRKGAFIHTQLTGGGAVMRTDIIRGDFVEPVGSTSYRPKGEDTMFFRTTILNSHNGTLSAQVVNSYVRLICLNGMVDEKWSARTRAKHTSGLNIESFRKRIAAGLGNMTQDADRFGLYARTAVTCEQAEAFFKSTIAKMQGTGSEPHWSKPLVAKLLKNFRQEDSTVWGVWNALTAWATHGEMKQGANALTTELSRSGRVASAMRSDEWKSLLAA